MTAQLDVNLAGKVALVTGATGGIGKEIARNLARMKATLVLGARSLERGESTRKELVEATGNTQITVMELDLASLASIRSFAAAFQKKFDHLHLLFNNAGAWYSDRRVSPDGHELTLATNVLGPYLLNSLLTDTLKASAPSRIVNMVSGLAANYDVTDLEYQRRKYDGFKSYGQSKAALRMLTFGLAKQLEGSGVTVNCVAPGFVRTEFNRNASGFVAGMINVMAGLFADTPAEGADSPTWAAVAPELAGQTGRYFVPKRREAESKFRDPAEIAALERACGQLASGAPAVGMPVGPSATAAGSSARAS